MIRRLRDDEPIPAGQPRRYVNKCHGYVVLRWKTGTRQYVEMLEHRYVAGRTTPHVHHINRNRQDNRPENLRPVTPLEHGAEHSVVDWVEAADLYAEGWHLKRLADRYCVHYVGLLRGLRKRGVKMRSAAEGKRAARGVDLDRLKQLWSEGLSERAIARALGQSRIVIRDRREQLGLTPRRPGRPTKRELSAWHAYLNGDRPMEFKAPKDVR
jgi:hypothetical protein